MKSTTALIVPNKNDENLILHNDKCDKYDYMTAVACGVIGGLVDIFLVGSPSDSVLGRWTDKQVDNAVIKFAKHMGWNPRKGNESNVKSAIGFLEHGKNNDDPSAFQGFRVNYDQRKPSDVNSEFTIAPNTHHMMSLAHSPDVLGLFFSILNQFTSTSTFIANGKLITINTQTFELEGHNPIAKIFCGVTNWFGHLMSDVAGGSGAHNRGTGIVMPFYELFGFCKFGSFTTKEGKADLATVAMKAFESGYDFRFGIAMAIPVLITELSIRLIWSLRQYFHYKRPLKECIPTMQHGDLRIMLLVGHGTLCLMDGIDAGVRSGGNAVVFMTRLNLVGWYRFVSLVLKEVCIRLGIKDALQREIEAFKRVNVALQAYLSELEKIDIEKYKQEVAQYADLEKILRFANTEEELNKSLLLFFEKHNINKPWQGEFSNFMQNKNNKLVFE